MSTKEIPLNTEQIIPKPETRIYVASLSDYNAGILHGEWIDLQGKDVDDVHAEIQAMLCSSPSIKYLSAGVPEEWVIHDYEGFGPINLGEYETTETVVVIAELINEHGGAFAVWYAMKRDDMASSLLKSWPNTLRKASAVSTKVNWITPKSWPRRLAVSAWRSAHRQLASQWTCWGAGPSPVWTGTERGGSCLMTVIGQNPAAPLGMACTCSGASKNS
ncbi:antirestriction protein ArdA [Modestobacter sp. DSM 44400]|uniref:antirestriction protein ArdA n=1 Tax=Modestobacter sp. DSM 44400 TaxID=1550230 RepID=UPI000B8596D4|nr:antirestriction protein ArdA [Modestobacter sp. DSM 44400]